MSERFFIDVEMWDSKTRMYMDDLQLQRMWEKIHGLEPTPPPENEKGPATEEELLEIQSRLKLLSAVDPSHYDFPGGVQVIDITKHLDFLAGNVVKYVCRAGRKGDKITDLLKAKQYLEWLIERESGE